MPPAAGIALPFRGPCPMLLSIPAVLAPLLSTPVPQGLGDSGHREPVAPVLRRERVTSPPCHLPSAGPASAPCPALADLLSAGYRRTSQGRRCEVTRETEKTFSVFEVQREATLRYEPRASWLQICSSAARGGSEQPAAVYKREPQERPDTHW